MYEPLASKTLCIMKFCTIIFYGGDNFLPAALLPLLEVGGSTLVFLFFSIIYREICVFLFILISDIR